MVTSRVKRSSGLIFLVLYKAIYAIGLFILSIVLLTAWRKYSDIEEFSLETHRFVVQFAITQILRVSPRSLEFGAIGALLYSMIAGVEAIGLWFGKAWARWLVLISVALSLPVEVWELIHHMTGWKWLLFVINLVVFWYVLIRFPTVHD